LGGLLLVITFISVIHTHYVVYKDFFILIQTEGKMS
jgi:hypothetical protein